MRDSIPVNVSVEAKDLIFWLSPFRRGARVRCHTGEPLFRVLVDQFGLLPDYIEKRVRTVFINGCPVDDLDTALISDHDELALAGALPGLVGICMGRNSPVAGFRRDITFKSGVAEGKDGSILLKLFNTVGEEAGPLLLARGILLTGAQLRMLAESALAEGHRPKAVTVAAKESTLEELCRLPQESEVELNVRAV